MKNKIQKPFDTEAAKNGIHFVEKNVIKINRHYV